MVYGMISNNMRKITVVLFLVAAGMYFLVGRHQTFLLCSVFKILPLLLLFLVLTVSVPKDKSSKVPVVLCLAALFFSMMGDVFGELKGSHLGLNAFLLQIVSFAVAQVLYTVSFVRFFRRDLSLRRNIVRIILCLMLSAYMIWFGLYVVSFVDNSSLKTAVSVYVILIGGMGLSSVIQCRKGQWWFIIGALLFICSDSIIAYRSFVGRVPHAGFLIMSTYYAAQLLLIIPLVSSYKKN